MMDRLLVLLSLGIVALIVAVPLWHELRHLLGWLRSARDYAAVPLDLWLSLCTASWGSSSLALKSGSRK